MIRIIGVLLAVLVVSFVSFYFWAKAPSWSATDYDVVTTFEAPPADSSRALRVMTYNIGYLSGMTNNLPVDRPQSLVASHLEAALALHQRVDADIVGYQEIDFESARGFGIDQLDTLGQALGYHAAARAVNWDKNYVPFPYGLPSVNFGRVVSGQGILSRYPIASHVVTRLERPITPFYYDAFYLDRLAQVVVIETPEPIAVINVHLEAFDATSRGTQGEELLNIIERWMAMYPTIVMGDFNTVMPVDRAGGWLSDEDQASVAGENVMGQLTETLGLVEVLDGESARSFLGTYPADAPVVKIDHILVHPDQWEVLTARVVPDPSALSDHLPVVATVRRVASNP